MPQATACAGKQIAQYLRLKLLRRRSAVKIFKDGHGTKIYYAYAFKELENDEKLIDLGVNVVATCREVQDRWDCLKILERTTRPFWI